MITLPFVETKEILKRLNATLFFKEYLPHIKNVKHKMRGTDGNGKPIDFTDEEKKQIAEAVQKQAKDFVKKMDK